MFCELREKELALVSTVLQPVALAQGEYLFEEGEEGDALYIVSEGTVAAVSNADDNFQELHTFYPGDVLGEIGLIMDIPRTASILG